MAEPNPTKLTQLPWPALVGASLLLHAGALFAGLPVIFQVDSPPDSAVDIPVTLVDEADIPVAVTNNPPATVPPPAKTIPASAQPVPLNGRNPTVEPQPATQTASPPSPQNATPNKPTPETPANPQLPETPATKPNNGSETPNEIAPPTEAPPQASPENPENQTPAEDETQNSESESGAGSIAVRIRDTSTVPRDTPGDWPDILPVFQGPSTLTIAGNHTCNDALPAGEVTLGLVITDDGSVTEVLTPAGKDTAAAQVANCLLTHALRGNPAALQFVPAYTGQQAVFTDRLQITLQFSGI